MWKFLKRVYLFTSSPNDPLFPLSMGTCVVIQEFMSLSNKKITSSHHYNCSSSYLVLHSQAQVFSQFLLNTQKGRGPWAFVLGLRLCSPYHTDKVWEILAAKVPVPPSLATKKVPLVVGDTHRYPGWVRRKVRVTFIACISLCVSTSMCSELCKESANVIPWWISILETPQQGCFSSLKSKWGRQGCPHQHNQCLSRHCCGLELDQHEPEGQLHDLLRCHGHHWYSWVSWEGGASLAWDAYRSILSCSLGERREQGVRISPYHSNVQNRVQELCYS